MEEDSVYPLPDLVLLEHFGGDSKRFINAVYDLFRKDFVDSKPVFRGVRLGLKKHPVSEGKEATFWHMISEGEDEKNRTPDIRRMERIKWPAPLIKDSEHAYLKVWENSRGNKTNVLIFHEEEQYLVVLRKGKDYLLPWTAYCIEYEARKRKLLKEYEAYKNAESAQ